MKRERFLILAREPSPASAKLLEILEPLGKVEVVVDRPGDGTPGPAHVLMSDEEAEAFGGMMSDSGPFPWISAWSRALCHLSRTRRDDEAVWFVEDDVAGNAPSFGALVEATRRREADLAAIDIRTRREDGGWPHWRYAAGFFAEPARGFQPLCRLSPGLVDAVLELRAEHGRCTFHEVMFASVAVAEDMRCLPWSREPGFRRHFGEFRHRPEVRSVQHGVCHPVKDAGVHEAIATLPPPDFPRMTGADLDGWSILEEDYVFLVRFCRRLGVRNVVEFGPGDSTLAFLDAGCRVTSFEHDEKWLESARERFAHEERAEVKLCPADRLPGEVHPEPELVLVDGPPWDSEQPTSRLPQCEWALDRCGCLILHDAKRRGEEATLAVLEGRGMHVFRIPTRKGLAFVTDPVRRPEMLPESAGGGHHQRDQGTADVEPVHEEFHAWEILFGSVETPVRALEVGAAEGVSANLLLDRLFRHEESEVHCIDQYEGEPGAAVRKKFEENAAAGGHASRLLLYEGLSREILAWMIAGDGFWEGFDFIHLNGRNDAAGTLADACQAWPLLKPGGVIVFGREAMRTGETAVRSFLEVHKEHLTRILDGRSLVVRRRR